MPDPFIRHQPPLWEEEPTDEELGWDGDIPVNYFGETSDEIEIKTYDDLLRHKWRLQERLSDLKRAMVDRDARAVDEVCALGAGDTNND